MAESRETMGKKLQVQLASTSCVWWRKTHNKSENSPQSCRESHPNFRACCQVISGFPQKTVAGPSIPIVSLVHRMRRGTGRQTTPSQTKRAGFIQAFAFIEQRDPARGRADIPPGGARSRTSRKAGQGGGLISGSRSTRPFSFWGTDLREGRAKRTVHWAAGSEAKATTRWTARGGCQSRPLFAVCWRPPIRAGSPARTPNW